MRREIEAGRLARISDLLPSFVYAVLVPLVGQAEALRRAEASTPAREAEG
jgi:hypothetical protein